MNKPKTVEELFAAIEAGKRAAQQRLDAEFGAGTYALCERLSQSEQNRRNLERIAEVCRADKAARESKRTRRATA